MHDVSCRVYSMDIPGAAKIIQWTPVCHHVKAKKCNYRISVDPGWVAGKYCLMCSIPCKVMLIKRGRCWILNYTGYACKFVRLIFINMRQALDTVDLPSRRSNVQGRPSRHRPWKLQLRSSIHFVFLLFVAWYYFVVTICVLFHDGNTGFTYLLTWRFAVELTTIDMKLYDHPVGPNL